MRIYLTTLLVFIQFFTASRLSIYCIWTGFSKDQSVSVSQKWTCV